MKLQVTVVSHKRKDKEVSKNLTTLRMEGHFPMTSNRRISTTSCVSHVATRMSRRRLSLNVSPLLRHYQLRQKSKTTGYVTSRTETGARTVLPGVRWVSAETLEL